MREFPLTGPGKVDDLPGDVRTRQSYAMKPAFSRDVRQGRRLVSMSCPRIGSKRGGRKEARPCVLRARGRLGHGRAPGGADGGSGAARFRIYPRG
jgi:hypothetical protein